MPRKTVAPTVPGHDPAACTGVLMSFRDAMETIGGKWKSPILRSLG